MAQFIANQNGPIRMLVSHRKKFIYTKTIKTAGTSVESYFEPYCMKEGEWSFTHARLEYISDSGIIGCRTGQLLVIQASTWWNHMPAVTIKALVGESIWDSYFKFCVIRNPFDKVVSAYHFFSPKASAPTLKQDFEAWLMSNPLPIDRSKYMIDGEFCMDGVIRYETLLQDIERICERLDIPYQPQNLKNLKVGHRPSKSLEEYYSAKSTEIVTNAYRYELDKFGYTFPI
ncbi:MAG: sulfotransferase family 2 domain-containing protein [Gallionella sp.]